MTIALDAALSGLRAAQRALDTASNNIANASTPGFTRKILPQEALLVGGNGVGVQLQAVTRNVNLTLIKSLNNQVSIAENFSTTQGFLDRIQDFHGPSEAERTLSAQLSRLSDAFTKLSSAPNDTSLLNNVVSSATATAGKINDFAALLSSLRTEAETTITSGINEANLALTTIAKLNVQISQLSSGGQSTATLEDQRDLALKTVSKYLQISTFPQENKKLTVMTAQGQILADETARKLVFTASNVLPTSYYPSGGLNGLTIDSPSGVDITQSGLGGQIGALFDLRDAILPQYISQLDEFSQKLAERFQNEGLKLFTDAAGNVPASVADPALVGYVGFSSSIQVNNAIASDPTLIRDGTTGNTELSGSNEVVRRIAQFAFGAYAYQQANGTANISAGALVPLLTLAPNNRVTGTVNIATAAPDLSSIAGLALPADFNIAIGGGAPVLITVNAADTAAALVANINAALGSSVASLNSLGQLAFSAAADITLTDSTIGAGGFAALGHNFGVFTAPLASFQVQVGTRTPVTVSIALADTSVQLLTALNAIPGLTASLDGGGRLVLTPTDGGDIKVTDGNGTPLAAMGISVTNVAHTSFRQNNLGADGTMSTELLANSSIEEFSRGMITLQGEDNALNRSNLDRETAFQKTLEQRVSNESGVNIDQELSDLIRIQTAYTAAAKMISATERLFDDLMNAFR